MHIISTSRQWKGCSSCKEFTSWQTKLLCHPLVKHICFFVMNDCMSVLRICLVLIALLDRFFCTQLYISVFLMFFLFSFVLFYLRKLRPKCCSFFSVLLFIVYLLLLETRSHILPPPLICGGVFPRLILDKYKP